MKFILRVSIWLMLIVCFVMAEADLICVFGKIQVRLYFDPYTAGGRIHRLCLVTN